MSNELWAEVDRYIGHHLKTSDDVLEAALRANAKAQLPAIDVSPAQGKLLYLLARIQGARRILEIGTLGGYSTIWLARSLPKDGKLISLEVNPKHAEVARNNIAHAGLSGVVEIRVGAALDTLDSLGRDHVAPFDLVFIDADKGNNSVYVQKVLALSRPGTAIVVDNVVREGGILRANDQSDEIQGTRRLFEMLAQEPRLEATALQTVGQKKHDGFVLARVK